MNSFVLVVTVVLTATEPSRFEAYFSSEADCESARTAILKEASLFSAILRRQERSGGVVIGIPQVSAVCSQRISD